MEALDCLHSGIQKVEKNTLPLCSELGLGPLSCSVFIGNVSASRLFLAESSVRKEKNTSKMKK